MLLIIFLFFKNIICFLPVLLIGIIFGAAWDCLLPAGIFLHPYSTADCRWMHRGCRYAAKDWKHCPFLPVAFGRQHPGCFCEADLLTWLIFYNSGNALSKNAKLISVEKTTGCTLLFLLLCYTFAFTAQPLSIFFRFNAAVAFFIAATVGCRNGIVFAILVITGKVVAIVISSGLFVVVLVHIGNVLGQKFCFG
jgi:hypothetical protein